MRTPSPRRVYGILAAGAVAAILTGVGAPAHADVNDFFYSDADISITLGATPDGRAEAHVVEDWTAVFPDTDQNRGIIRGIPRDYKDAAIGPSDITVTDGTGGDVPFEVDTQEGDDGKDYSVIALGDDSFQHG
ncbi:MAG: DUF2207 domain-containing protein, partial [Mycetocola sp.]